MGVARLSFSRRAFIVGSSMVGGAVALGAEKRGLSEQNTLAPPEAESESRKMWSAEYWAKKGEVKLYLYRKRLSAPQPGQAPLPVVFMVHGSTFPGRESFDLDIPGHGQYSAMDRFAEDGFDVWTMDFEGYGRSSRTEGNSDIASGVEDLKSAEAIVERETGEKSFHFYGEASGALRAGAFATVRPERVRRLVLVAFTWTGKGSATLKNRAERLEYYRTHNRRPLDRDVIRGIFTRDQPGTADPAVADALMNAQQPFGDTVPSGTYLDMITKLPIVDPPELRVPVLLARGEYDHIATEEDQLNFFSRLPNPDRQFAVIPGASQWVGLGYNRHLLWHTIRSFLDIPQRRDSLFKS